MIDFYNAFISYRHAPLDSKIAEHIQKQLEHFHVPHNLKSHIEHDKITRIFSHNAIAFLSTFKIEL